MGLEVGKAVGEYVGCLDFLGMVGLNDGENVGFILGESVGASVGICEGGSVLVDRTTKMLNKNKMIKVIRGRLIFATFNCRRRTAAYRGSILLKMDTSSNLVAVN